MQAEYSFKRAEEIYRRGQSATYVYRVVRGAVQTFTTLKSGDRRIAAFYFAGEVFGLEHGRHHRWSAAAIPKTTLHRANQTELMQLAHSDEVLARLLWRMNLREFMRAEDHALIVSFDSATERVAAFLLDMEGRLGTKGGELKLPMSRRDIGDYLGVALETVARAITSLESMKIIERLGDDSERRIRIIKRDGLIALLPPLQSLSLPFLSATALNRIFH